MTVGVLYLFLLFGGTWTTTSAQAHYKNLYGTEDFNTTILDNILDVALGSRKFCEENIEYLESQQPDVNLSDNCKYDFIVIGAGTAGSTIASRLSEIRNAKILLIEAGSDETLSMDVPMFGPFLTFVDGLTWDYRGETKDGNCITTDDNGCNVVAGKVMGGSSSINYMAATRGSAADYDSWAEMGNHGWAYKDVLKYFKKLEDIQIPELRNDTKYHGTNGPVKISYARFHSILSEGILEAAEELGYPLVDYNGENSLGFSYAQTTTYEGLRMSGNRAHLADKKRNNLHVTKNSLVKRIIINERTKRATGVELLKNGRTIRIRARKEVILSAGAIGSPQILMLSGIGPKEHLKEFGINVIKDLPVGENLKSHVSCNELTWTVEEPITFSSLAFEDPRAPYLKDYLLHKTGPLSDISGTDVLGFINVDEPEDREVAANIEVFFISGTLFSAAPILEAFGLDRKIRNLTSYLDDRYVVIGTTTMLHPKNRGQIRLRSKDINVNPKIDLGDLSNPEDLRVLIKGIRATREVGEANALKKYGMKLVNVTASGCEDFVYDSDEYWTCSLMRPVLVPFHHCGTCKMGPSTDETAVVDPNLKVHGIKGLRVADASIMPKTVSGHTNIPVFMIGEKAADLIKEEWRYPTS